MAVNSKLGRDPREAGLIGTPLYLTGHSIALGFNITPSRRWSELLAARYGMVLTNGAVGGSCVVENSFDMNGDTNPRTYGTPRVGMAILDAVYNSNAVLGNTAAAHQAHIDAVRTILAHLSCSARQEAANWTTKSGTWTAIADSRASSGNLLYSTISGNYIETTYTGKDAYVVLFGSTAAWSTVNVSLDSVNVTWDGSTTINTVRGVSFTPINYAPANVAAPFVVKVSAASSGTHTVRVTNLQNTFVFLDTLLTVHPTPQPVFVCKDDTSNPAFSGVTSILTTYNTETATVAAEFPNATVLDLNTVTGLTYLSDNTHLDEAGNQKYADFYAPYLLAKSTASGVHIGATQDLTSGTLALPFDWKTFKNMTNPVAWSSIALKTYWVGDLTTLTTTAKSTAVAAINEVNAKAFPNTVNLVSLTTAAAPAAASAAANVELFSAAHTTRVKMNLTRYTQVKISCVPTTLGNAATAAIKLQYTTSADVATWSGTDTGASVVIGNGTANLVHDSGWQTLAVGARADNVTVAAVVSVAFGTTAPTVSNVIVYFQ